MIEEIEAGASLAREFDRYKPVKTAFWLKASDEDERYLYLASDGIDDTNFDVGYGEVLRLANKLQSTYLDPFRVKVIGGEDPLARAAAEINERSSAQIPTRLRGQMFGGVFVDDVYIYPSTLQVRSS